MSETVNFTLDDVVAKVREVAAEKPTYVYDNGTGGETSSCFYRHGRTEDSEGVPGCIVGHALDRLGYQMRPGDEGIDAFTILNGLMGTIADPRARWARRVQEYQDSGESWGSAVERADSETPIPAAA